MSPLAIKLPLLSKLATFVPLKLNNNFVPLGVIAQPLALAILLADPVVFKVYVPVIVPPVIRALAVLKFTAVA